MEFFCILMAEMHGVTLWHDTWEPG
jgi:hypothetical protein